MSNTVQKFLIEENPMKANQMINEYLDVFRTYLYSLSMHEIRRECISGLNRIERKDAISSLELDIRIRVGDIVYVDFGQAYLNESGFQHFGLVLALFSYKAFVIPMSSNYKTMKNAPNYPGVMDSKNHLYYIGKPEGMHKESVLFLNDAKFINTARIINVIAHISPENDEFIEILSVYREIFE